MSIASGDTLYFSDNFESGNIAKWDELAILGGGSSIGAYESSLIKDSYVLRATVGDVTLSRAFILKTSLALDACYVRFTIRIENSDLQINERVRIAELRRSTNSQIVRIYLKKTSNGHVIEITTPISTTTGSTNLVNSANYRVEIRYQKNTNFHLWVEGTEEISTTDIADVQFDRFLLGLICESIRTTTLYYDEVYVNSHRMGPILRELFMDDPRVKQKLNLKDPKGLNFSRRQKIGFKRKYRTNVKSKRHK